MYAKRSRKSQFSNNSQDKVCLSESKDTNSSSDSEQPEEPYDNEDMEFNSFILSSIEEENLLKNFTDWLMSIDGGKRPARQAQKHKRIVMSIVQHNDEEEIKYQNLACASFWNSWMTKLTEEKKEAATIKTYLCSVKYFLDFVVATGNNILGNANLDKTLVLLWQWRNTLYREIQQDSHEKQVKAREFFPKPEEIKDFDNSQIVIMATRTLENSLTVHDFKINK